eukprot:5771483-Pyramimonas_sp.AAC.1
MLRLRFHTCSPAMAKNRPAPPAQQLAGSVSVPLISSVNDCRSALNIPLGSLPVTDCWLT